MFNQKEQGELINNFLNVVKVHDYFRELKEERRNCNARIAKNTNVIPLCTNCHYQNILSITSTVLHIFAVIVKNASPTKKRQRNYQT